MNQCLHDLLMRCFVLTVKSMYVYEGHDYSKETTARDQQAFDNMMAGTAAVVSNMKRDARKKLLPLQGAQGHPPSLIIPFFSRCEEQRKEPMKEIDMIDEDVCSLFRMLLKLLSLFPSV